MTTPITMPEAPETLAVQLAWLRAGRRRAVLVTVNPLPTLPISSPPL